MMPRKVFIAMRIKEPNVGPLLGCLTCVRFSYDEALQDIYDFQKPTSHDKEKIDKFDSNIFAVKELTIWI